MTECRVDIALPDGRGPATVRFHADLTGAPASMAKFGIVASEVTRRLQYPMPWETTNSTADG